MPQTHLKGEFSHLRREEGAGGKGLTDNAAKVTSRGKKVRDAISGPDEKIAERRRVGAGER